MKLGQQLVQILHGQNIVQKNTGKLPPPSKPVQSILKKAHSLSRQDKFWHHHMLFPNCRFNPHPGQWTIMFEDLSSGGVIESVTDSEPKADLKHIETLFYQQKR